MAKDSLDPTTLIVRSDETLSAPSDDETVMFNAASESYYGLDRIGTRIWDLLETPTTITAITECLRQEFEVDAETCLRDVTSLVQEMFEEHLVTAASL